MSKRYKQKRRQRYYLEIYTGLRDGELPAPACWCGVKNPYFAPVRDTCGGFGYVDCRCGGDICVCHNHGETECYGCADCEEHDHDDTNPDYEHEDHY
jgi:hypothetical protein